MKYKEIHKACKWYGINNYTINGDGTIDVNENVYLYNKGLRKLPLKFNKVSGYFYCGLNELTNLEGSPKKVGGFFDCSNNALETLEGAPLEVDGYFNCDYNDLRDLRGAPRKVGGGFYCLNNLVDLDYDEYLKKIRRLEKITTIKKDKNIKYLIKKYIRFVRNMVS